MDGFLDVSKALWKGLYSRRDCIRQHINFPAVLRAWVKTKDVRFTQWPDVAFSTIGEGIYRWPFIYYKSHYVPNFCMARQEVKPTLKFGFQVYRQFVCEEGFQDFCAGPILIANYILISPQFKK